MSYRTFVDSAGRRWEVWLVTPAAAERRRVDRRTPAGGSMTVGGGNYEGVSDRRITPALINSSVRRILLGAGNFVMSFGYRPSPPTYFTAPAG